MKKSHYLIKLWLRVGAKSNTCFEIILLINFKQTVFGKYWFLGKLSRPTVLKTSYFELLKVLILTNLIKCSTV